MNNQPSSPHPAWIEIDIGQFRKNIAIIRQKIKGKLLCLPVKANAYGHGLTHIAQAAVSAGVDYLAVSCLKEGEELRKAGIKIPILVMGAIHEEQIHHLIKYNLETTISSAYKAALVKKVCEELKLSCRVHLEIDTGMQRTGMRPKTALKLLKEIASDGAFSIVGIYSHLAKSDHVGDSFTAQQIQSFTQFKEAATPLLKSDALFHLANSGAVLDHPEALFDLVRPGILAFGYHKSDAEIKPFLSLKAKISYFKVVDKNTGISYGHSYITKEQTRIITIPVGYGDGLRRALSNRGNILLRGKRYPIVGSICMDQLMVDIGNEEAYVGEEVVLVGEQGDQTITIQEIAELCDTISYEILCAFNQRLPRIYRE